MMEERQMSIIRNPNGQKRKFFSTWISPLALTFLLLISDALLLVPEVLAQCPLCKAAASSQSSKAIDAFNSGIVVLLVPPVIIFTGVFAFAVFFRNAAGSPEEF